MGSAEEAQRGGRVSGNGNPMHRGHVASPSFEEDCAGGRASWVPQYEGIEGAIRMRNYSPKTLASYRLWMRKFQSFVRSKPADELDGEDAKAFLTDLAIRQGVAASTQNQAFNALLPILARTCIADNAFTHADLQRFQSGDPNGIDFGQMPSGNHGVIVCLASLGSN